MEKGLRKDEIARFQKLLVIDDLLRNDGTHQLPAPVKREPSTAGKGAIALIVI